MLIHCTLRSGVLSIAQHIQNNLRSSRHRLMWVGLDVVGVAYCVGQHGDVTSAQRTHNIVLPVVHLQIDELQIDEHKEAHSWHNTELIKA